MAVGGADDLGSLATSFNEMAASLQEKLRELEELSKAQRQFVSDVSHELRTPMTTIRMAAEILYESREQLDAAAARSAELLQSQTERFEILLTDLLEISRHDANVATLDAEPADMCDIVRRSADDAQQLAERRGCRIEFRLPAQACLAEVDRRRVERILRNLLVNAVEHGEGKDVVVTVAADRDAVAVAVRDHGVGLGTGEDQLVFERFWRADPARARTTGGTGLGLAIALEDARLHGGWLQAWGEKGRGSVFRLTLPRIAGQPIAGSPLPLGPDEAEVVTSVLRRTWRAAPVVSGLPAPAAGRAATGGQCSRVLAALVVAASAAGCVSMPTRRPVQSYTVTQGPGAQSQHYQQIYAQPPGNGWSPEEIVSGFLTASASFANQQQMAREYLTPHASRDVEAELVGDRVQQRRPRATQTAYPARNPGARSRSPARSRPTCPATAATPSRSAKEQGVAAAPSSWPSSTASGGSRQAPQELLLTSDLFKDDYQLRNLYFFDPTGSFLVPDPVYVPLAGHAVGPDERAGA